MRAKRILVTGEHVLAHATDAFAHIGAVTLKACAALVTLSPLLFLATLTAMLFRPANVDLFPLDRLLFAVLTLAVMSRALLLKQRLPFLLPLTLPMASISLLSLRGVWARGYEAEGWSVVAAQFIVPFVMFHLAGLVFTTDAEIRKLELFGGVTLGYLCFISIAFISGQTQVIFPRFILDTGVEMHLDRARGPFLQAVANGMTINILALLAFRWHQKNRMPAAIGAVLLAAVPAAIFATMTRSVWLSFVLSILVIAYLKKQGRIRRILLVAGAAVMMAMLLACTSSGLRTAFQDRFEDRETVDFRMSVYQLGWEMFREKPLLGWGQGEFAREIQTRISDFRPGTYAAHNTFIDILVEHGAIGLFLYLTIAINLFRLTKRSNWLGTLWPICLGVYFLNACFVVINYQFVNALVFTCAGVVAGQKIILAEPPASVYHP